MLHKSFGSGFWPSGAAAGLARLVAMAGANRQLGCARLGFMASGLGRRQFVRLGLVLQGEMHRCCMRQGGMQQA